MDMKKIKWAWQRVVRGYDDRVYWGFDSYFIQVIPALKYFCETELKGTATHELNPERHEIFTKTLELIGAWEKGKEEWVIQKPMHDLFSYVGAHLGYYWD